MEDIQLVEDSEVDKTTASRIRQANHEDEDLDINPEESKEQAKDNDKWCAQQQYPTTNSNILKTFMTNAIRLLTEQI